MWIITFIILISLGGSYALYSECTKIEGKECQEMAQSMRLPENADEMYEQCKYFIEIGNCIIPVLEKCNEEERYVDTIKRIVNYAERTCDPDNEIFKGIQENFQCVMSEFRNPEICNSIFDKMVEDNVTFDFSDKCANEKWHVSCQAVAVSVKCGEESRDAALDILMNTEFRLLNHCTQEEIQTLPEQVESFELILKEIELVENIVRRKK